MLERCHECGGTLFECRTVQVVFDQDNYIHIVDQVPADVCMQCGERYFSSQVTQALAAAQGAPPDDFVQVPISHLV